MRLPLKASRAEKPPPRVLILTQHEDAARWHRLARAQSQSPSPRAHPPVREQRPAPSALLPGGTHVVPAAIYAEGGEEGRVVPAHHERGVRGAQPGAAKARSCCGSAGAGAAGEGSAGAPGAVRSHCTGARTVSAPSAGGVSAGSLLCPRSSPRTPAPPWFVRLQGHTGWDLSFPSRAHHPTSENPLA